jgi:hypothetical protein
VRVTRRSWVWIFLALAALVVLPVLVFGLWVPRHVRVTEFSGTPASSSTTGTSTRSGQPSGADLEAVLQAPASLPEGESVEVRFILINRSETGLYVLKWYTPLEGLQGDIFRVTRDGEPIPYNGRLVLRGDPTGDDYVHLDPGESVSATVDLATVGENGAPAYDFSRPGCYTIAFISPRISHVAKSVTDMARSVEDLHPIQIPSEPVRVEITGSSGSADQRTVAEGEDQVELVLEIAEDLPDHVRENLKGD